MCVPFEELGGKTEGIRENTKADDERVQCSINTKFYSVLMRLVIGNTYSGFAFAKTVAGM